MLTVITGPMFSGKTSKLQSIYKANVIAKNYVVAFRPSNDTRHPGDTIVNHDGIEIPSRVLDKDSPFKYYLECYAGASGVLFFDECQFFNIKGFRELIDALMFCKRDVFCAGLSCDSEGNEFGAMGYLLATADHIIINKAVCSRCRGIGIATRTYRKVKSSEQTIVGGAELYEPRCFKCWREHDNDDDGKIQI